MNNRIFTVILSILSLCGGEAYAQKQTYVGVTAGPTVSTVYFNHLAFRNNIRTAITLGAQAGLEVQHYGKKNVGIINTGLKFGLNYVQRGYNQDFRNITVNGVEIPDFNTRLNYLEIPFQAIIYVGRKKTKIAVSPGIYMEFLLSSELTDVPPDQDTTRQFINVGASNVFPYNEETDITRGAGGRLDVAILRDFTFGALQISGNVSYTITNILDFGSRASGIPDTSNNLTFGVSLGYFLKFNSKVPPP